MASVCGSRKRGRAAHHRDVVDNDDDDDDNGDGIDGMRCRSKAV